MKRLFLNSVATKTAVVIALIVILTSTISVGVYFTSFLPSENPNQPTPSPAETGTPPNPQPATPSPTMSPASSPRPSPSLNFGNNNEPVPSPSRGLLDDLTDEQKGKFETSIHAALGNWSTYFEFAPPAWTPGATVRFGAALDFSEQLFNNYKTINPKVDYAWLLLTAERDFDPEGYQHTPWDDQVSTILTPAGLPIEGGGSVTTTFHNRNHYRWR